MRTFRSRLAPLAVALALAALRVGAQGPFALLHTLREPSSEGQPGAGQGSSVAIDGNLVAVGAPGDDVAGQDSGLVKIYHGVSGTLLHTLTNPSPALGDLFGLSVAISGTRVVVGAPYDDAGGADSGRAYVYDMAGVAPTIPVTVLNNPGPAANDFFGYSVAVSGTLVVIGAHQDDTRANDSGSAYVFDLTSVAPGVPFLTLTNPTPAANDNFGWSVSISRTLVVIGAYRDDVGGSDAGAAYLYDVSAPTPLLPVLTFTNPSPAGGAFFGYTVGISGKFVVVGAPRNDIFQGDDGGVYFYDLASITPAVPAATLANPNRGPGDSFGRVVAIAGSRVAVGAFKDSIAETSAGITFVYDVSSGTPGLPVATLTKPTSSARSKTYALPALGPAISSFGAPTTTRVPEIATEVPK